MTGADYDPLALPRDYFDGLPTGVPNNLPSQPEPEPEPYVRIWLERPSGKEVAMLLADDYRHVMRQRDELRTEVEQLRAALRIYADSGNWFYDQELEIMQWVGKDDGPYIAQQTLKHTPAGGTRQ